MNHPNKVRFIGVLTQLDVPSSKSPSGARGHLVVLTAEAAKDSLGSLIGMGVSLHPEFSGHDLKRKAGVIEEAEIVNGEILVSGYLWKRDFSEELVSLQAAGEEYGMSYEVADAHIEDMRSEIWKITRVTFTGAAVLLRSKAAYRDTDFLLVD